MNLPTFYPERCTTVCGRFYQILLIISHHLYGSSQDLRCHEPGRDLCESFAARSGQKRSSATEPGTAWGGRLSHSPTKFELYHDIIWIPFSKKDLADSFIKIDDFGQKTPQWDHWLRLLRGPTALFHKTLHTSNLSSLAQEWRKWD